MKGLWSILLKTLPFLAFAGLGAALLYFRDALPAPGFLSLDRKIYGFAALVAFVLAGGEMFSVLAAAYLALREKPAVEGRMLGRVFRLSAVLAAAVALIVGFDERGVFTSFFTLFGGMMLGWSLQAPVSGLAAWLLIQIKRPIRPGDRVQFPALDLTGDVQDLGTMYLTLNQVGGSIASEEVVGRKILLPNAMLFQQVIINYTALQDAPFMLDEVVIRITYDSDWNRAEKILLDIAWQVTRDIADTTGVQPYIRSELYDYGVYLRLRYQTRVKDRAEISYRIEKQIFEELQRDPTVDIAIPYVYSYRSVMEGKTDIIGDRDMEGVREIELNQISTDEKYSDSEDIAQLARSIQSHGLLQPVIVTTAPETGTFKLLAGHLRFAACRKLGWKTIPAVIR